ARAEVRNSAWARSIIDLFVTNLVGTGFTPKSEFGIEDEGRPAEVSERWRRDAHRLWYRWAKEADADGGCFEGVFSSAVRGMLEGGDGFIVRVLGSDGVLRLRVLEAEMLPLWKNEILAQGGYIRAGCEFNAQHERVAYWFHREHPGEFTLNAPSRSTDLE